MFQIEHLLIVLRASFWPGAVISTLSLVVVSTASRFVTVARNFASAAQRLETLSIKGCFYFVPFTSGGNLPNSKETRQQISSSKRSKGEQIETAKATLLPGNWHFKTVFAFVRSYKSAKLSAGTACQFLFNQVGLSIISSEISVTSNSDNPFLRAKIKVSLHLVF